MRHINFTSTLFLITHPKFSTYYTKFHSILFKRDVSERLRSFSQTFGHYWKRECLFHSKNCGPTERHRKTERTPKDLFSLTPILKFIQIFSKKGKYSLKIFCTLSVPFGGIEVGRSFSFCLAVLWPFFGQNRQCHCSFHCEIATSIENQP